MMAKNKNRHGKSAAVRNALGRLGWQANPKDVAALLANFGVEVSEGLVRKVKIKFLKQPGQASRQTAAAGNLGRRRRVPALRKTPAQRTYRR